MLELIATANRIQSETGRGVIALSGKAPVTAWKQLQDRIASETELIEMFSIDNVDGLGMIQGGGFVVLDIDDKTRAAEFARAYPQLWTTLRVGTRRGVHLHYEYGPELSTQHLNGADLIAAGGYVVMPPSGGYVIESNAPRFILNEITLKLIIKFFAPDPEPPKFEARRARLADEQNLLQSDVNEKLEQLYKQMSSRGRNNALYSVARYAHQNGYDPGALSSVLELFISSPKLFHRAESDEQRRREGQLTIKSAYTRATSNDPDRVTTELRQYCIAHGLSAEIRGYEILRANGYNAGDEIHYSELRTLYSDYGARRVIAWIKSVSPRPFTKTADADSNGIAIDTQSMDCNEKFSTKIKSAGRPASKVVIPSVSDLLKTYGLSHKATSVIQGDSLLNKAAYHAAALRELITRIAGQSQRGRSFQAKVFNVSQHTIRAWSALTGIVGRYAGKVLSYFNIKHLPELDHCWIQDENNKRYPANQGLAARLLSAGKRLKWFNRSEGKVYYPSAAAYEMSQAVQEIAPKPPRRSWPIPSQDIPEETISAPDVTPEARQEKPIANDPEPRRRYEPVHLFRFTEFWAGHDGTEGIRLSGNYSRPAPARSKRRAHRIAPEHENLCNRIQSKLPTLALKTIEHLIQTHGPERVIEAFTASINRSRITNPSGYFITILERS